jgi:hypothetical protein
MEVGIQGGSKESEDDHHRQLYFSDIDYFRQHPGVTQFVRSVSPVDGMYLRGFEGLNDSWSDVKWVLVVALNQRRDLRIRIPLREGDPQLTDGDVQLEWLRRRTGG